LFEPAVTSDGDRTPFFSKSHSIIKSGLNASKELAVDTRCPEQKGQLAPRWLVLEVIVVCHRWSSAAAHFHHAFLPEPTVTSDGDRAPFFSKSHSLIKSGLNASKELAVDTRCPEQKGHPVRMEVRRFTGDLKLFRQSRQRHQIAA
jgi:hypothetical protein